MSFLIELVITLGSTISAVIGAFITAHRRRITPEPSTPVELRVMGGEGSKTVRLNLPTDLANRLMREGSQVPGSKPSP